MTKRVKMGFLQQVRGLSLLDKVKTIDIRQSLNFETLLLRIERSDMRWYDYECGTNIHEETEKQLMLKDALSRGKMPSGEPRTR